MDYSTKTRTELVQLCKDRGLKGYTTKKKDELIALLSSELNLQDTTKMNIVKPLLKWVGGKTQIINEVMSAFPLNIVNYYEPFLGGGSVLLALLSYIKEGRISVSGKIYASDLNSNLIGFYKNVQTNSNELISELRRICNEFSSCNGEEVNRKPTTLEEARTSQESYYYWIRSQFNALTKEDKMGIRGSAMLLFLNKTCFRGVYREGPNGFNVPYGNYKNPSIFDEGHIHEISELIRCVIFREQPFTDALSVNLGVGDFVYLDPPYAPEADTSFVSYTADGFSLERHNELFELCGQIYRKGIKFVMSNADVTLVRNAFPYPEYTTKILVCRRAINSKNPDAKTNEVLIQG